MGIGEFRTIAIEMEASLGELRAIAWFSLENESSAPLLKRSKSYHGKRRAESHCS